MRGLFSCMLKKKKIIIIIFDWWMVANGGWFVIKILEKGILERSEVPESYGYTEVYD